MTWCLAMSLVILTLAGCAPVQMGDRAAVTEKVGQSPPLGTRASAAVGGVVFSQFRYWSRVGYRLDEPVDVPFAFGRVIAPEGEGLVKGSVDGKDVLCTERRTYHDRLVGPHRATCFLESEAAGTLTRIMVAPGVVWTEKDLPSPVRYSHSEQLFPRPESFKHELLYQGRTGNTLRLSYRAFLDDLARPASLQDVAYDIGALPVSLAFKAVNIEVLAADESRLTYRVLSGF